MKRLLAVGTLVLGMLMLSVPLAATVQETFTICHAAGQVGTLQYVELTLPFEAVFGEAGHFFENGTPRAGHEEDILGLCPQETTTTQPTTSSSSTTTITTTTTTLATTTTFGETTQPPVVNPICIDCNNATVADLMQLVGVNETLALAIIANRPYERLQDLVTKGVMTGAQLLLILVVNQDTGAFASDACLQFSVPSTTTVPGETTSTDGTLTVPTVPPSSFGSAPRTPSPGDEGTLPFTGIEDWLLPLAAGLVLLGIPLVVTMRKEET